MTVSQPLFPSNGGGNKAETKSFKDKLLGSSTTGPKRRRGDLFSQNLAKAELEGGNRLLPKIFLEESIREELRAPWKDALIVKLLGKEVGFITMRDRLKKVWKSSGGFDMMDLGYGFFLVKFDRDQDRPKVVEGGPWMVFDHYLTVQPWSPDFVASSRKIDTTMVWIRIPCLNVGYYDEDVLLSIASMVGHPVKIDQTTMNAARGKFARVCVEITLSDPVVGRICLDNRWYRIEYEGLHIICASYRCYGHFLRDCVPNSSSVGSLASDKVNENITNGTAVDGVATSATMKEQYESITDMALTPHGEWLTVTRKKRSKSSPDLVPKNKGSKKPRGSRFRELEVEDLDEFSSHMEQQNIMAEKG